MSKLIFVLALFAILTPSTAHSQSKSKLIGGNTSAASSFPTITAPILRPDALTSNLTANEKLTDLNNGIPIASPTTIGSGTLNSSSILFTTASPGLNGAF